MWVVLLILLINALHFYWGRYSKGLTDHSKVTYQILKNHQSHYVEVFIQVDTIDQHLKMKCRP